MSNFEFDWLKKWAEYSPDNLMLREYHSGNEWSYSDFNNKVNYLANCLQSEFDIKKGERVAVLSKNNHAFVALFFACAKIGAILVPINFRLTTEEIKNLTAEITPKLFIFQSEFEKTVSSLKKNHVIVNTLNIASVKKNLSEHDLKNYNPINVNIIEDDPIMILFTSGSTGIPKGAIVTHKMLFWNSINTELRLDINSRDHTLSFAPFYHTGGWNVLLTPFIHHGASQTMINEFNSELIIDLIEKEKVTILFGVPTMLQMMAETEQFKTADLSSLRYIIVGGAPMPIPLIEKWHNKGVFIRQGYGLTEVGPNCFSLSEKDAIKKIGSIGFPNFYIDAKLINQNKDECKIGESGELWLRSPVVTPGYWNQKEETEKAISNGWFHTGDIARKDEDGYYFIVDRKKNMFISGGENVYPAEIEKALYFMQGIKDAAVIGVNDKKWGEVGAAFIVPDKLDSLNEELIIEYCKTKLAKYKIPKHFRFLSELPLNSVGKIDKMKLIGIFNSTTNKGILQ